MKRITSSEKEQPWEDVSNDLASVVGMVTQSLEPIFCLRVGEHLAMWVSGLSVGLASLPCPTFLLLGFSSLAEGTLFPLLPSVLSVVDRVICKPLRVVLMRRESEL